MTRPGSRGSGASDPCLSDYGSPGSAAQPCAHAQVVGKPEHSSIKIRRRLGATSGGLHRIHLGDRRLKSVQMAAVDTARKKAIEANGLKHFALFGSSDEGPAQKIVFGIVQPETWVERTRTNRDGQGEMAL